MDIPQGKPWKIAENRTLKGGSSPPPSREKNLAGHSLGETGRSGARDRDRYPGTRPSVLERLASVRGTLTTGDYSVAGLQDLFSIERKAVSDLVDCCMGENREQFERELHRLRGYRFKRLLVVGSEAEILAGHYQSNIKPNAVLATVCAFEVYDLPVVFVSTARAGGRLVERWAFYFARETLAALTIFGEANQHRYKRIYSDFKSGRVRLALM